jgi:hypothetical protein
MVRPRPEYQSSDLQPHGCIEIIEEIALGLTDEAFLAMQENYLVEEQHGLSHRVDGSLYTLAGNIDQLLEAIMNTEGLEAG